MDGRSRKGGPGKGGYEGGGGGGCSGRGFKGGGPPPRDDRDEDNWRMPRGDTNAGGAWGGRRDEPAGGKGGNKGYPSRDEDSWRQQPMDSRREPQQGGWRDGAAPVGGKGHQGAWRDEPVGGKGHQGAWRDEPAGGKGGRFDDRGPPVRGGDSWRDGPGKGGRNDDRGDYNRNIGGGGGAVGEAWRPGLRVSAGDGGAFGASALGSSWRDGRRTEFGAGEDADQGGKRGKGGGKADRNKGEHSQGWGGKGGKGAAQSWEADNGHDSRRSKGGKGESWDEANGFDSRRGKGSKGESKGGKGGKGESRGDEANGFDSRRGKGESKGGKGESRDEANGFEDRRDKGGKGGKGGGKNGSAGGKNGSAPAADEPAPVPDKKRSGGTGAVTASHLSSKKFSDLEISKESKRALAEGFGYELMTNVQAATIGPMLAERDVVARARTGTGKTLAFLVPIVERLAGWPSGVGGSISSIILSPTRELAAQIASEAELLLKFHAQLGVACFYGGTNIKGDHNALKNKPVDILVATPGRLQDHLDNTPGFRQRVSELYFLALDEADQLLDMGFRDAILKILKAMPAPDLRQGALFSATFPNAVGEIAKLALKKDHDYLDTVRPDEEVTPDQIDQSVCVTDMEGMTELLWKVVNSEMKRLPKEHKIMVFFTTARATQLYSELFCQSKVPVLEIHSRKSQAHRNRCADQFRASHSGIIFSSDVSARGLDYPDVTTVVQVGIPSARDQYIHRLGRTGRAGKSGRCILLLHDFEEFFLKNLKDLPVKKLNAKTAFPGTPAPPDSIWQPKDPKTAGQAYQAWLGYYNSVKGLGWPKDHLVREATRFAASIGGTTYEGLPPPILRKTVGMMGLKNVPGLNIVSQLPYGD